MRGFVARFLLTAFGLWAADAMMSSITLDSASALWIAALVLGIVNTLVRPIVILLTLPLTLVTFGLFLFVVNGAMLLLAARFVPGFHLEGLGTAILGSIIVGLASWAAGMLVRSDRRGQPGATKER
jgi:putative membrane protein